MFQLPNMEDAFRRARYARTLTITGTFNRDIAVRREDLVFFAPGTDAWTDAIVANALEADRGRCCAIYRKAPELPSDWRGFELLYSLTVDPRSLYESGADPIHLFRAQGYLQAATYRLLIGQNGQLVKANSPVVAVVDRPFDKAQDVHLGKRDGRDARIKGFKDAYPPDAWNSLLQRVFAVAEAKLDEELSFLPDEAEEAQRDFVQRALGWKASDRWRQREFAWMTAPADIDEYERASEALVAGLARPVRRLESVCFWVLRSGTA
jgi:ATP-dependent helicase HepA